MQLFICAGIYESSATNSTCRPFFPTRRNAADHMASAPGKTLAYISLGMHELCGELQESSCGSAGCSAAAGHAAGVQMF